MAVKAQDLVNKVEQAYTEKWGYIWGQSKATWTKAKQDALYAKYKSDPVKYSDLKLSAENGSKWIGHTVTDCSGLPYWALKQLGVSIYHGSNSIWKNNLSHKGELKSGMKLPKGAAIFTSSETGKDHMGTLISATAVNEAHGTLKGVIHTPLSNKKWKYWGLYKGVEYEFIPGEEPVTPTTQKPTLRKGSKGADVTYMQELLLKAGEALPKYGADGDFGSETLKAVKSFQKKHNLVVDGIVGKMTWGELLKYA